MQTLVEKIEMNNKAISRSDIYKMDEFLDAVSKLSLFDKKQVKNQVFYLRGMISAYNILLEETFNHYKNQIKSDVMRGDSGQLFEKNISLSNNLGNYNMIWSVEKLKNIIKRESLKPIELEVLPLVKMIDVNDLKKDRLKSALNDNTPIILADYPSTDPNLFILDGNHRAFAKYNAGCSVIKGYLLPPGLHIEGLISRMFELLVIIHNNINLTCNYALGEINIEVLKKYMKPVVNNVY